MFEDNKDIDYQVKKKELLEEQLFLMEHRKQGKAKEEMQKGVAQDGPEISE